MRRAGAYIWVAWVVCLSLIVAGDALSQAPAETISVSPLAPPEEGMAVDTVRPIAPETEPLEAAHSAPLLAPLPDMAPSPEPERLEPSPPPEPPAEQPPPEQRAPAPREGETAPALPSPAPRQEAPQPVNASISTYVLDPGHGGIDPGVAVGDGLTEKGVTLPLAQSLGRFLLSRGARALYTRTEDQAMTASQRAAAAKGQQNALIVSLHAGRCVEGQETAGVTVAWDSGKANTTGEAAPKSALAAEIGARLVSLLRERGIPARGVDAPIRLQQAADAPVLLIECGCLESKTGRRVLTDEAERDALATSLGEALLSAAAP